ncbi:putative T7SS-secreted protein [Symbioplanes lichenis]|uniref:putative T7SS-secreted protein n=1 Tax=Symbioplanes lichenis TaxID=1629072 RepID=UPI00273A59B7|nr:toxin glutamine deamidase domain-containing protein [Actinoplanes lichenis]
MSRPTDWDVLDMSGDPTPGDPARLRQLAGRFHDFAETAHRAKLAVESLQGDGSLLTWVGLSGDAFRKQFGDFPNQVNKLYQSHLMAGDALEAFAPVLETAQAQADRALVDGRTAAEKVRSLQGALDIAQTDFTGASQAAKTAQAETVKPDPDQVKQAIKDADAAQQRLSAAQGQVNGAQQELDLAKQLAEQAKQMRDGAARTCVRQIEDASDAGIQPRNFWQKLGDALKELWNIICEVAKWVALVAGIIAMIIGGPLAWIALAAGAILLVKAIVDFAQGKGSVLDLVMGILGIIPGVKGLTSLSKLSALYKAGGVKEIAKATLTGMKNMAKDMVGLVKAAGQGAVTIVKKLGDSGTSVLGAVKNAGVIVGDAVKAGGAKIGDLFTGGAPKPTFGAPLALPPLPVGVVGKSFTQRFQDLAALKSSTSVAEAGKVRATFASKLQADQAAVDAKYQNLLTTKVGEIKADTAAKLNQGKLDIEARYQQDLAATKLRLTTDFANKLNLEKAAINARYDQMIQARPQELQAAHLQQHNLELANIKGQFETYVNGLHGPDAAADAQAARVQYDQLVKNLESRSDQAYQADLAQNIQQLENLRATDLTNAENLSVTARDAAIHQADVQLTNVAKQDLAALELKLGGEEGLAIQTATTNLDNLRIGELNQVENISNTARDAELVTVQGQIDTHFKTLDTDLHRAMLNGVGQDVVTSKGTVKTISQYAPGIDPADLDTIVAKNWPKLDQINPNRDLNVDVNCSLCVTSVDKLVKTGVVVPAPKLNHPQILPTIENRVGGGHTFSQFNSYADVLAEMRDTPRRTVGIIGYKFDHPVNGPQGHVLNVVSFGKERVAIVDGQSGKLGDLPNLDFSQPGNELWFMKMP